MTVVEQRAAVADQREGLWAGFLLVTSIAVFVVLIPAAAIVLTPESRQPWQFAAAVMIWAGIRFCVLLARGRPYLFEVTTWVFVYVFLGLAPMLQMRLGVLPDTTPVVSHFSLRPAMVIVIVGLVGLEVGTWLGSRRPDSGSTREPRVIAGSRLGPLALLTFAYVSFVVSRIGVAPFFESRDALSTARTAAFPDTATSALVIAGLVALPLVMFHALVQHRRQLRAAGQTPGLWLTTMLMGAVLLLTTNPISSPRILFGTVLLSLAILAGATKTRARTRATIAAILVGMVLVFPAADIFRSDVRGGADVGNFEQLATSGDYDSFAQIANTHFVVEHMGVSNGRQALGVVFFWLPRSQWENKPIDTGVLVAQRRNYGFTNLSAPLWAEAYINAGMVGVPLLLGLYGFLTRRADIAFARGLTNGRVASIAGAILPFYALILLRGSLLAAMGAFVALVAALWLVSTRKRR